MMPVVAQRSSVTLAAPAPAWAARRTTAKAPFSSRVRLDVLRIMDSMSVSWLLAFRGVYGQLFGNGGSTRTYVMGPVMFTPQEVIWNSA